MLPKVGATLGGRYALEAIIGRGGMGAVYRAKNQLTGRRVALKWILPSMSDAGEMRTRLLREARAMGRIEHPNVCAIYDVGEDGDAIYLVMELLRGRTVRAMLDERKPLGVEETCAIVLSAMQGVAAAHLAGVIHRDLKPDNLFVCEDEDGRRGPTKVLDFGVSKILDAAIDEKLTKSGTAVGTPHYMSPEQIVGSRDVDHRSDVYALGAILFQCLTGRLPFEADTFSALVVRIAMADPDPFGAEASPEAAALESIVLRAISKRPEQRYPDVAALAAAIEPFAGGARFEAPRAKPRSVPPPPTAGETSEPGPSDTGSLPTLAQPSGPPSPGPSVAETLPAGPLPPDTPRPLPSVAITLDAEVVAPSGSTPGPTAGRVSPAAWTFAGVVIVLLVIGAALASTGESEPTTPRDTARATTAPETPSPDTASPASAQPARVVAPEPVALAPSEPSEAAPTRPELPASAPEHAVADRPATDPTPGPSASTRRGGRRPAPPIAASSTTQGSAAGEHTAEPHASSATEGPRTGSGRSGTLSTDEF